jgi:opacity protein-like surface antigen
MRSLVLAVLAAAVLASAVLAAAGTASSAQRSSVIHLKLPGTKSTYVDLGRKGYSPGDYFLATGRLLDAATGKLAGHLGGVWTLLSRAADNAAFDLGLARGTIIVDGRIVHAAKQSVLTVTGGTGAYQGARGTVTFRYLTETTAALDVSLR